MTRTILIAGAGLAGARCAETLRAEGFSGRVVLVGEEQAPPYTRPALSKELLAGTKTPEEIRLRPDRWWAEHGIDLVLGTRIETVSIGDRAAVGSDGAVFRWDSLVLATGTKVRRLPCEAPCGVHYARTLEDALALRAELGPGKRLAIVGAGFVGTEVASTAAALGCDVTLVATEPPLLRAVGAEVGSLLASLYEAHGIAVRTGVGVDGFDSGPQGRLAAVRFVDGTRAPCDAALVAIGVMPDEPLFRGGGAIETDGCGRTQLPSVYACGDVAASWRSSLGRLLRVEHWTNAAGQGTAVAHAILGESRPHDDPPYFWSDQFGLRLQFVGHADGHERVELEGAEDCFTARYLSPDGRLLAALTANRPGEAATFRRELAAAA